MKKTFLLITSIVLANQADAACTNAKSLSGTWRYYQAVAQPITVNKANISRCEAAFKPDAVNKLKGTFEGFCWISPAKGPKTMLNTGTYEIKDPKTCDVQILLDMMGQSTFNVMMSSDNKGWIGQWTNKAGDWGVTNGLKKSTSTQTPLYNEEYDVIPSQPGTTTGTGTTTTGGMQM